jgi:hypothetical protein
MLNWVCGYWGWRKWFAGNLCNYQLWNLLLISVRKKNSSMLHTKNGGCSCLSSTIHIGNRFPSGDSLDNGESQDSELNPLMQSMQCQARNARYMRAPCIPWFFSYHFLLTWASTTGQSHVSVAPAKVRVQWWTCAAWWLSQQPWQPQMPPLWSSIWHGWAYLMQIFRCTDCG